MYSLPGYFGKKKSFYGERNINYTIMYEELYMHLDNFVLLEKPISAFEMKEITDCGYNFRQTLFSISEEAANKLLKYVRDGR